MKKLAFMAGAALLSLTAGATYMQAPMQADPEIVDPDSTGFKFTDIKTVKSTPVKDQNKSGTCWSFSGIGMLEDEILRKGGPETDLSEMFVVRNCYIDKAKRLMRMYGDSNFAQGGQVGDVLYVLDKYGAMPEEAYAGLNYGDKKHSHYEMAEAMDGYLRGVLRNAKKKGNHLTDAWLPGFIGILDAYFGPVPEKFTYKGKEYTPESYAASLGLNPKDYIGITSFTHHPFYEAFAVEIPDNWLQDKSMNVPMEELQQIVDNALENGYPVAWAADVSEGGFKWKEGYAIIPAEVDEANMTDSEVSKWVKLDDKARDAKRFEKKGPQKEITVTQEMRQKHFDNWETTDDHGMVLEGIATDQEGNRYYKVRNSWDTNQVYGGYFYVSMPYFLDKTISVMLNKEAVPKSIAKKFK
ncbi:MAG: C1 family peptidase [Muribaculaceae bacterium]|nr:C1 family peptidase [Muribaculaceae bacterium]